MTTAIAKTYDRLLNDIAAVLPDDKGHKEWDVFKSVINAAELQGTRGELQEALKRHESPRKADMVTFFANVIATGGPEK